MQQLVAHVTVGNLAVDTALYRFVRDEVLPGSGIDARAFWRGFDDIVHEFAPRHRALLARRAELQTAIDAWHRDRIGEGFDAESYRAFLDKIGYLEPDPRPFQIGTPALDVEVASVGGPQVVVPLSNARYSLNAANARWGSLYDALYGTDALGIPPPMGSYDAARGADVIDWARRFLDDTATLATGSHADVIAYRVADRALQAELRDGSLTTLDDAAVFVG